MSKPTLTATWERRLARLGIPLDAAAIEANAYALWLHQRKQFVCCYCRRRVKRGPKLRAIDHVLPLTRGGRHCVENLVPSCKPCNSRKWSKTVDQFPVVPPHLTVARWRQSLPPSPAADDWSFDAWCEEDAEPVKNWL